MTPEDWEHVERVVQAALLLEEGERSAYLDEASAGNAHLRREVESLLAHEGPAGTGFLSQPAVHAAARAIAAVPDEARPRRFERGARLGPYEVQSLAGAGGMGEVYEARDTRLERTVAIKVLPGGLGLDQERRARFQREAKAIAGLNHPHICTLYDIGEEPAAGGAPATLYLVMEHLAGETLAARLERGALPVDQALQVATEIADALAAAHRRGVVHRDLKPGNVMLTKAGATLLDFGLAKLTGHGEQAAVHLVSAPSTSLTARGAIVGTLQYMAPEQVEGTPADARADLWALGAILYEMLTGRRAFEGTTSASLMVAIIEREPAPVSTLRAEVPAGTDRLVRRCLAKSPDDRPDTAHDVASDLRWLRETSAAAAQPPPRRPRLRPAAFIAAAVVLVLAGAGVTWLLRPAAPRGRVTRVSIAASPADEVKASTGSWVPTPGGSRTAFAWTPDGHALVFVGRREGLERLYVRDLEATEARPLPGTEGAKVPAVSADGRWVAFWAGGAIKKVPLRGGPVMDVVADARAMTGGPSIAPSGLAWDERGVLYFGGVYGPVWATPADGPPVAVTKASGWQSHGLPWPLPGGAALLYTVRSRGYTWGGEEIVAQVLASGERKVLVKDGADARYVPTGHLLFLRRGVLFAVGFDVGRMEVLGEPEPVLDGVAQAVLASGTPNITGAGQFAVSTTGTLAWLPGRLASYPEHALVEVDRRGRVFPLPGPSMWYGGGCRLSPDGRRVAVTVRSLDEKGVWTYDLARGAVTPLARDGEADWPIWMPDGNGLVFSWVREGRIGLATQAANADGTTPPRLLAFTNLQPASWTRDGSTLAGVLVSGWRIGITTFDRGEPAVRAMRETSGGLEQWPAFSPDGRWLAYGSTRSGRSEVYIRPYPGPGDELRLSVDGGESPAWTGNGREVVFVTPPDGAGTRRMMAADFVAAAPGGSHIGRHQVLFEFEEGNLQFAGTPVRTYDVSPDGQRFYVIQRRRTPPPSVVTHIELTQNWLEELKAKVPVQR